MKPSRLHIIVIKPSQLTYMPNINHHKYISSINTVVAKQCLWPICVKNYFLTGWFLSHSLNSRAHKTYITEFMHLVLKFYKTKIYNVHLRLLLMLETRVSDKAGLFLARQSCQRGSFAMVFK